MRLENSPESRNVEDRRGMTPAKAMVGGGGLVVILMIIGQLLGIDPRALMQVAQVVQAPAQQAPQRGGEAAPKADDPGAVFVRRILGLNEEVWHDLFEQHGQKYQEPTLVMFFRTTGLRSRPPLVMTWVSSSSVLPTKGECCTNRRPSSSICASH